MSSPKINIRVLDRYNLELEDSTVGELSPPKTTKEITTILEARRKQYSEIAAAIQKTIEAKKTEDRLLYLEGERKKINELLNTMANNAIPKWQHNGPTTIEQADADHLLFKEIMDTYKLINTIIGEIIREKATEEMFAKALSSF